MLDAVLGTAADWEPNRAKDRIGSVSLDSLFGQNSPTIHFFS
jgi:hypothetical protein